MFKIENFSNTPLFSPDTAHKISDRIEQAFDSVWHLIEHPEFPFVSLEAPTNNGRQFPPYNIIELENGQVRLDVAVAGYTKDRLSVELEGNALNIKGTACKCKPSHTVQKADGSGTGTFTGTYRKQGISNSAFLRSFTIQPNTIVEQVSLSEGILSILLLSKKPEPVNKTSFKIA